MNKKFFNRLEGFSFKDLLACIFVAMFVFLTYKAATDNDAINAMQLVNLWIPIILTIVGAYFIQEVTTSSVWNKLKSPSTVDMAVEENKDTSNEENQN
jgi:hypothetical protein